MSTPLPVPAPGYRYHLLRGALERFAKNPTELDGRQLEEARRQADRTWDLESLVLGSAEARTVMIPSEQVETALAEVASRYPDPDAFASDLASNGLSEELLRKALYRELVFDSVMQRIASRRLAVSGIDARLYYELHAEKFRIAERRRARQILITINEAFEDNRREVARARIERIAARLAHTPNRFADQARRYSECPSALAGGKLGEIRRGQLFPQLDSALFALPEGALSGVLETGVGFHLLWCEKVTPARAIPFSRVESRIQRHLEGRNRRNCQKAFVRKLRQNTKGDPSDGQG